MHQNDYQSIKHSESIADHHLQEFHYFASGAQHYLCREISVISQTTHSRAPHTNISDKP